MLKDRELIDILIQVDPLQRINEEMMKKIENILPTRDLNRIKGNCKAADSFMIWVKNCLEIYKKNKELEEKQADRKVSERSFEMHENVKKKLKN